MKHLNNGPITDTAQFPIKKGTLEFLQLAHKETASAIIIAMIGNYNPLVPYILYGCVNSGTYPNYSITSGAIFFFGEVYFVPAASFNAGANVAVLSITTTQYTTDADPVTFTDASIHNVHDVRAITIAAGAPGSTIADFSDCIVFPFSHPNASQAEVDAGTEDSKTVTPKTLEDTPSVMHVDGSLKYRTLVLNIGDWQMDAGATRTVAHGLADHTKIRNVQCTIRQDAPSTDMFLLNTPSTTGVLHGGIASIDATNINLMRVTSGAFDSASFDDVSYNRGFVTITYEE